MNPANDLAKADEIAKEYLNTAITGRLRKVCAAYLAMRMERCDVCNAELSQCGPLGVDGEPSLACKECELRDLADSLVQRAEKAERELSALRRPGVWVPLEPTVEMGRAFVGSFITTATENRIGECFKNGYRAMLAAARGSS